MAAVPPELYAHRLGCAYGPDSSAAALTRALERPLDGLETDCCPTAVGELVLLHDPLLEVVTMLSGWAHERTAAQIRVGRFRHRDGTPSDERPLPVDELLERALPGATLQLEIKAHADPALARRTTRALCERVRDHPARERTEVISFWSGACELAGEPGFRARLVASPTTAYTRSQPGGDASGATAYASSTSSPRARSSQLSERSDRASRTGTLNHVALLAPLLPFGLDAVTATPPELGAALGQAHFTLPRAA